MKQKEVDGIKFRLFTVSGISRVYIKVDGTCWCPISKRYKYAKCAESFFDNVENKNFFRYVTKNLTDSEVDTRVKNFFNRHKKLLTKK